MKVDIDGTLNINETVDIIASGYEWNCPICEILHKIIEYPHSEHVHCERCGNTFHTDLPEHAMG